MASSVAFSPESVSRGFLLSQSAAKSSSDRTTADAVPCQSPPAVAVVAAVAVSRTVAVRVYRFAGSEPTIRC